MRRDLSKIIIAVPCELHDDLRKLSARENESISTIVRTVTRQAVARALRTGQRIVEASSFDGVPG